MRIRTCVPSLLLIATACGVGADAGYIQLGGGIQGVVHPTEDARLSSRTDMPVSRIALPTEGDARLPDALSALATFDDASAVGLLESPDDNASDLVFGTLIDAEIAPDGNVLLLDGDYSVVRVLSPTLEPIQTFGGEGQGPGELDGPESLMWLAPDELGVFQPGRIEVFQWGDGAFEYARRVTVTALPAPDGACTTGESMHFTGIRFSMDGAPVDRAGLAGGQFSQDEATIHPETVHELGMDGEYVRSYSTPYLGELPYDNGGDRFHLAINHSGGPLACDIDRVWAGYSLLGEVHAFDEEGSLAWIARVTDLGHPGLLYTWNAAGERVGRSGSINVDLERGDFTLPWMDRLTLVGDVMAAQVTRNHYGPIAEGERQTVSTTYSTYLLDAETGRLLGAFDADHQILAGRNRMVILYQEAPYPRISVVRLED